MLNARDTYPTPNKGNNPRYTLDEKRHFRYSANLSPHNGANRRLRFTVSTESGPDRWFLGSVADPGAR